MAIDHFDPLDPEVIADPYPSYRWLLSGHQSGVYRVRALADGANQSRATAAYRRAGLGSAADTVQRFAISSLGGQPATRLLLASDAP